MAIRRRRGVATPRSPRRGHKVNAFATDLKHPRWIYALSNGDVLIAESSNAPRQVMRNVFDYAMVATMRRARAVGVSANRITLLRDADGDGVAEIREVFSPAICIGASVRYSH